MSNQVKQLVAKHNNKFAFGIYALALGTMVLLYSIPTFTSNRLLVGVSAVSIALGMFGLLKVLDRMMNAEQETTK